MAVVFWQCWRIESLDIAHVILPLIASGPGSEMSFWGPYLQFQGPPKNLYLPAFASSSELLNSGNLDNSDVLT